MKMKKWRPCEVWSGAQTGADQGGLEGARLCGIGTGGHVPRQCRTEVGPCPELIDRYGLTESKTARYKQRTRANVLNSHITIWFGYTNTPGYYCTAKACEDYGRPLFEIRFDGRKPPPLIDTTMPDFARILMDHKPDRLNIAGNKETKNEGIFVFVRDLFIRTFGLDKDLVLRARDRLPKAFDWYFLGRCDVGLEFENQYGTTRIVLYGEI